LLTAGIRKRTDPDGQEAARILLTTSTRFPSGLPPGHAMHSLPRAILTTTGPAEEEGYHAAPPSLPPTTFRPTTYRYLGHQGHGPTSGD